MPRTFVAKIRKGERRDKRKPRFLRGLADPHPNKDRERRKLSKGKAIFLSTWPSRILSPRAKIRKDDGICMCLEEKKKRMLNFC